MNEMQLFKNPEFGSIRAIEKDGEPWFVGKDICKLFGDTNHNRSLGRVDSDDKTVTEMMTSGGKQQITIVNESGLYSLLFAMQPQKANHDGVLDAYPLEVQERIDKLHRFKRWVTSVVLPSIRKHGAYATPETLSQMLNDPASMIEILQRLKAEQEQRKQLEAKAAENAPKVLFADSVAASHTSILVGELAKLIRQNGYDIGQRRLFQWLRDNGYLIKRQNGSDYNMPTQRSMELGLFEIKETTINHSDGSISVSKTVKVTGKGQLYFINKFLSKAEACDEVRN